MFAMKLLNKLHRSQKEEQPCADENWIPHLSPFCFTAAENKTTALDAVTYYLKPASPEASRH